MKLRLLLVASLLLVAGILAFRTLPSRAALQAPQATLPEVRALEAPGAEQFHAYWSQGKAEITSYDLEQARYGEIHRGHAVLIYVTEDFSLSKQVKLDRPDRVPEDSVKVLKLNLTKKFNTGVYPYSVMQSVFTPVDRAEHPSTLKTTMSAQEWCGHVFTQLNLEDDAYAVRAFSYFESEGDEERRIERVLLEDELWTVARLDPGSLPTGPVRLLPGTIHARLRHEPLTVQRAEAKLVPGTFAGGPVLSYSVTYPRRELVLHFEKGFPHELAGWEESHASGFGPGAKRLTTRATRKRSMLLDYWNTNGVANVALRRELGL